MTAYFGLMYFKNVVLVDVFCTMMSDELRLHPFDKKLGTLLGCLDRQLIIEYIVYYLFKLFQTIYERLIEVLQFFFKFIRDDFLSIS